MRKGFTLLEIAVALAIIGILAAMGWGGMQDQLPRFRMIRAARGLKADLMNLRNLAVQSNRQTRMRLTGSGGQCSADGASGGSWEMAIGDRSNNATTWDILPPDEGDSDIDQTEGFVDISSPNAQSGDVCLKSWETLTGPGVDNHDAIVFSPRGWVVNPGEDFSHSGYMELTLVNQAASRQGVTDEVSVVIYRSGMVRMVSTLSDAPADQDVGTDANSSAP